jgi:hypothetical protein
VEEMNESAILTVTKFEPPVSRFVQNKDAGWVR